MSISIIKQVLEKEPELELAILVGSQADASRTRSNKSY